MILDASPEPSPSQLRRSLHHTSDVLIVGAGILGCALAITLARQGRSVFLLEKSLKEPDRIVGELLQPGGVEALKKLGIRDCLEGIDAVVVKGYEVIYYGEGVEIPYPEDANGTERRERLGEKGEVKRPEGRSFHHGRFIRRLRETAMQEANISLVETTVTGTIKSTYTNQVLGVNCTTTTTTTTQAVYFADLTVIADGYASRFRKEYIPYKPLTRSKFYGLELIDADLPRKLYGQVVLGDGAPVLLYQIGTHETRALIDIPEGLESASPSRGGVKAHLKTVVLPSLPACVRPSFAKALEDIDNGNGGSGGGRLRSMPNSFLPPSVQQVPGMMVLGDAMNMRHPLTGGGMTVAFNDVVLLRELLSPENVADLADVGRVKAQMKKFHWRRKNLSAVVNILAMALYQLFAANGNVSIPPPPPPPFPLSIPSSFLSPLNPLLTPPPFCFSLPSRPPPQIPPARLFPVLPAGRAMRRRARRPPRRHRPPPARPRLPFLRRRRAGRLDHAARGPAVAAAVDFGPLRLDFGQGVCGFGTVCGERGQVVI